MRRRPRCLRAMPPAAPLATVAALRPARAADIEGGDALGARPAAPARRPLRARAPAQVSPRTLAAACHARTRHRLGGAGPAIPTAHPLPPTPPRSTPYPPPPPTDSPHPITSPHTPTPLTHHSPSPHPLHPLHLPITHSTHSIPHPPHPRTSPTLFIHPLTPSPHDSTSPPHPHPSTPPHAPLISPLHPPLNPPRFSKPLYNL